MIRLPTELHAVLDQGGTVVVPSRQRAHAARLAYAAAELARGRKVWVTPDILPVEGWLTREIERYAAGAAHVPRLLSPAEEWFLWRQCAAEATRELELVNRGALAQALRRSSAIAADFAIAIPEPRRTGPAEATELSEAAEWPGIETALLAEVHRAVEDRCRELGAATVASLARLLVGRDRSHVMSAGFLSLPPRLRVLVADPIGTSDSPRDPPAPRVVLPADELDELESIAAWCKSLVERDPHTRILVILPGAPGTRERLAALIRQAISPRAWLDPALASDTASAPGSSDSLVVIEGGAPLADVPAIAHALSTLSWLGGGAGDFETVSGWLRAPYWRSPNPAARARLDLWLREREQMRFNLRDLVAALSAAPSALASVTKDITAQVNKAAVALGQGATSPREWSERFRTALEVLGWPGERTRTSGEQQTVVRFHELLDEFGQLASIARSISRDNAIQWFTELATRTAFRPADEDAVITVSSVLADPVVRYDAIWVAGLHAEAFPQPVQPDPFLPLTAQIAAGVPAATAEGRLAEARSLLTSWRACADELVLSAPSRAEDLELLPSPMFAEWRGTVARTSTCSQLWLPMRAHREGMLESFEDGAGVAWQTEKPLPSGTRSLELQNQCPFRAYAELRLGSTPLDAPEPGVAADLRGQLLHAALHKLWMRLRDSRGLAACADAMLETLIHRCVEEAANETQHTSPSHRTRPSPVSDAQGDLFGNPRYSPSLTRECRRAERLIRRLCALERERAPFRVQSTELDSTLALPSAHLRVRIDRVDALETGGRAIFDYKSGRRATADWYGERPSHPQLLAYLAALGDDVVAMATINVTARGVRFDGIANTPELLPKVKGVEGEFGVDPNDAWATRRAHWIALIQQLAADFVAGRAAVDPKPGACDYCHVASVCRISDRAAAAATDEALSGAGDE